MSHKEYKITNTATAPVSKLFNRIRAEVNKLIKDNEFEFHEHDIFEVDKVWLDKDELEKRYGLDSVDRYYGSISGTYVHDNSQKTLPLGKTPVMPLDTVVKRYPVVGEYVICINHMGRTYYKTIINWSNNPNNNIQVGASSNLVGSAVVQHTMYTNNKDHRVVMEANPGDTLIQGRYGNSINIGSENLTESSIKLVAGHNDSGKYDINKDKASIYIQEGGYVNVENPNDKYKKYPVVGSKVVINADEIVLNARKNLKLVAGNRTEVLGKEIELKHNKGGSIFTGETKELLDSKRDALKDQAIREIELCIEQLLLVANKAQEDYQRLKGLVDTLRSIPEISSQVVDTILGAEISLNSEKFNELSQRFNRIVAELPTIPPNDPVRLARVATELAQVLRDFTNFKELFRPNIKLGKPSE